MKIKQKYIVNLKKHYDIAGEEPDSSATEVITLTPPTDSTVDTVMKALAIIGFAGVIIALVIVVIKKKMLRKQL